MYLYVVGAYVSCVGSKRLAKQIGSGASAFGSNDRMLHPSEVSVPKTPGSGT